MAKEITVTVSLKLANAVGPINVSWGNSCTPNQTTPRHFASVQAIGTTAEALEVPPDITTIGWAYFRNLSATNYVTLGTMVSSTFAPAMRLNAGEVFTGRLATNAPYMKADTASVDVEYALFAD